MIIILFSVICGPKHCFYFCHSLFHGKFYYSHAASYNMQVLLNRSNYREEDLSEVTTAVFYSISSTQRGPEYHMTIM